MDVFSHRRGAKIAATATAAAALLVLGSPAFVGAAAAAELGDVDSPALDEDSKITGSDVYATSTETQPGTPIYETEAPVDPEPTVEPAPTQEPQPGDDVVEPPTEEAPAPTEDDPVVDDPVVDEPVEDEPTTEPVETPTEEPTPTETTPTEETPAPTESPTEPVGTEPSETPAPGTGGVGGDTSGGEATGDDGVVPAEPGNNGAAQPRVPAVVPSQAPVQTQTAPAGLDGGESGRMGGLDAAPEVPAEIAESGVEDLVPLAGTAGTLVVGGLLLQLRRRGEQH